MKTSKGFISPLLLALIAILILGGGAYVYVQNKSVNQDAVVQTSELKTYTNTQYGFEFKYSSDFLIEIGKTGAFYSGLPNTLFTALLRDPKLGKNANCGYPTGGSERVCDGYLGITIEVFPVSQKAVIDGFIKNADESTNVRVDNVDAKHYAFHGSPNDGLFESVYVAKGSYIFLITTSYSNDLDKMLPTFKFISSATLDANANWKTYTNSQYGFEVGYPENFFVTWEGTWGKENSIDSTHVIDLSTYEVAPPREYPGIRILISNFSGDFQKYIEKLDTDGIKRGIKIGNIAGYTIGQSTYFIKNGKIFSIGNSIEDGLFNQILSTFKFSL